MSPKIIILYYQWYSSGKFLSNILSFNDNFFPQAPMSLNVKRYNDSITKIFNPVIDPNIILKQYKIAQIFSTIPPSVPECKNWFEYELGCKMFWNFNVLEMANNMDPLRDVFRLSLKLLELGKFVFIVAHTVDQYNKLREAFPNSKCIQLINDERINLLSQRLKASSRVVHTNLDLVESFKFDIDTLFNKELFFSNVSNLMDDFNLDCKDLDPQVFDYYAQYTNLYSGSNAIQNHAY
jgi:hypothetical protein